MAVRLTRTEWDFSSHPWEDPFQSCSLVVN